MNELVATFNGFAELWWSGLVRASLQGGVALVAVWLILRMTPRLSPRVRCWFWRLAYLKLFLALVWASSVEVPLLPAPAPAASVTAGVGAERSVLAGLAGHNSSGGASRHSMEESGEIFAPGPMTGARPLLAPAIKRSTNLRPAAWALLLWLTAVIWCAQRIGAACRAAGLLRGGSHPVEDSQLLGSRDALAEALQVRRRPDLLVSNEIQSPMLLGGPRPTIVLPKALVDSPIRELQLILAHELAHLRRGDLRWNWLPAATHALFFFHPLVWIAGGEWRLCQEMACDELALRATHAGAGDYGEMLLKVAASAGRHPRWGWTTVGAATQFLGAAWSDDSPQVLRRRLQMLRYYRLDSLTTRRRSRWSRPTTAGALLAAAGLCLVPWQVTAQNAVHPAVITPAEAHAAPAAIPADPAAPSAPAGEPLTPQPSPGTAAVPNSPEAVGQPAKAPGALENAAVPGIEGRSGLSEQWEDVLLLEAMRYLSLTVAQTRETYPLAGVAQRRLKELAEHDRRIEASLARIARQSREALLAGQPGTGQREALQLEDVRRRKRARGEEELLDFVVPRLTKLLTRDQIIRACLLTIGEPPQERERTISPALLNPEAGFVLAAPSQPQPASTLLDQVNQRLGAVRSRWEERRQAAAKQELAGRHTQKVVDSLFFGPHLDVKFSNDAEVTLSGALSSRVLLLSANNRRLNLQPSNEAPEVAAARKDWEAIRARTNLSLAQLLISEASAEDLQLGLRAFARRMFLSPRLRPVLEARLRLRDQ